MVREDRNRLGGLGIDQIDQTSDPLGAKITLVAVGAQGIERDQSHRVVVDRIVDKVGIGRKISEYRKGLVQVRPVILIAGQDIYGRTRLREYGDRLCVFILPSLVNDVS